MSASFYIRLALFCASLLGFAGCFGAGYYKGRVDTHAEVKVVAVTRTIEKIRVNNEIINNKPDDAGVLARLREGTF